MSGKQQNKTMAELARFLGSADLKEQMERALERILELTAGGFVFRSDKFGRALVNVGSVVPLGKEAAFIIGYDTYVGWNPESFSFSVSSKNNTDIGGITGLGESPRTLAEALGRLFGGSIEVKTGLADYLTAEKTKGEVVETADEPDEITLALSEVYKEAEIQESVMDRGFVGSNRSVETPKGSFLKRLKDWILG